jgi:aminomethyltransferase
MLKRSQLFNIQQEQGAQFADHVGWEVPERFGTIDEDYDAIRSSAGLLDLSYYSVIEATGPDRVQFLHRMLTNDIKTLAPGEGCYATFLTPQGRTLADMRVYCLQDSLLLTVEPSLREKLVVGLRKFTIGNRVELHDRSEDLALLSIQGPKSGEFLSQVTSGFALSQKLFDHFATEIGTAEVRVCRVDRTLARGYDLVAPEENLVATWRLLSERGKPFEIRPTGWKASNIHRVEAGIPLYGTDFDEAQIPLEAGLDNAISLKKGCYIGQEIIARATYLGHLNRKLAGLILAGDEPATKGAKIFREEKEVGWITSSVFSPSLGKPIALGYLRREVWEPSTSLVVKGEASSIQGEVAALPFVTQPIAELK